MMLLKKYDKVANDVGVEVIQDSYITFMKSRDLKNMAFLCHTGNHE